MGVYKDYQLSDREKMKLARQLRQLIMENEIWSLSIEYDQAIVPDKRGNWRWNPTGTRTVTFTVG